MHIGMYSGHLHAAQLERLLPSSPPLHSLFSSYFHCFSPRLLVPNTSINFSSFAIPSSLHKPFTSKLPAGKLLIHIQIPLLTKVARSESLARLTALLTSLWLWTLRQSLVAPIDP